MGDSHGGVLATPVDSIFCPCFVLFILLYSISIYYSEF